MSQLIRISTREAALRLHVHARTVRKWIDAFEEYIHPELNERGHYMLTEEGFLRLRDIQRRLHETNKSMRQIRQDLIKEGKIEPKIGIESADDQAASGAHSPQSLEALEMMMEKMDDMSHLFDQMFERMERLEDYVFDLFDALEEVDHRITSSGHEYAKTHEMVQMFDEIRKKQDQLKVELRNATFSHRLAAATSESELVPRRERKSARFLGIF